VWPWLIQAAFPIVTAAWLCADRPFLAVGLVVVFSLLILLVSLSCQNLSLAWIALQLIALVLILRSGCAFWRKRQRQQELQADRLEEEVHTLEGELERLKDHEKGLEGRLKRYLLLRRAANTLGSVLALEDLLAAMGEELGNLIQGADRVLVYLMEPESLTLELKAVWQRGERVTIKAKTGDPFDWWVMRQAQPLLVEEPSSDFRFPRDVAQQVGRPLGALLSVPLMTSQRLEGVLRVESVTARGLTSDDLRLCHIVADLATLGIENSRLYQRTAQLAVTDDLTQLALRKVFEERLGQALEESSRKNRPVSVLMIDIDHFKVYNDSFGHTAGDKLLKRLGEMVAASARAPGGASGAASDSGSRAPDLAARYGGEEFVLLLPGSSGPEALGRAQELRSRVEAVELTMRRVQTKTTVSIGVATAPQDGTTAELLMRRADERLYRAKAAGRNQVCAD
jgi:diguanylate cyclase (GGDEF)-like protein